MRLEDILSSELLEALRNKRFDQLREKHEGPWGWFSYGDWREATVFEVDGRRVVLPVYDEEAAHIEIVRVDWSQSGTSVTLFLKDTTYAPEDPFSTGRVAICDRLVPGEDLYVAIVYHEMYFVEEIALGHKD